MLIFSVFFLFFFCNISLRRPTCLNHPLHQSKAALFSIFCFISLSGVKPAHDQPPPRLYFLIYPHHFLVLTPKVFGSPVCSDTRSTAICQHLFNLPSAHVALTSPHLSPAPVCLSFTCDPVEAPRRPCVCVCVCVCAGFIAGAHLAKIYGIAPESQPSPEHTFSCIHTCINSSRGQEKKC